MRPSSRLRVRLWSRRGEGGSIAGTADHAAVGMEVAGGCVGAGVGSAARVGVGVGDELLSLHPTRAMAPAAAAAVDEARRKVRREIGRLKFLSVMVGRYAPSSRR